MTKAVIIEDEENNIELLTTLINTHCSDMVSIEGYATNVADAIRLIHTKQPQLIYLDIELEQGNAFELLNKIEDLDLKIIFVTAYSNYAVKAFRYHALDYILKPINIQELKEATEKGVAGSGKNDAAMIMLEEMKKLRADLIVNKVGLPVIDGILFIDLQEIIKIEATGNHSVVYLSNSKKMTILKPLKEIEKLLPENYFLRVHNSWIINNRYLKKYFRGKNNYLEMDDGSTVPVSLRKKKSILDFSG
jgi:two-component system LytT family response regulator